MKKQRGITLIALVVTAVILLILATVSISMALGNNGILTKAKTGVETYRKAAEEELIVLGLEEYNSEKLLGNSQAKLKVDGATVNGDEENGWTVDFANGKKVYKVKSSGQIEEEEIFDPVEWDKKASDEDCFIWASDDPNSEDYATVIGYTPKADNNTILRFPSRTKKIKFSYDQEKFNNVDIDVARSYTNNIKKMEIPDTVTEIGNDTFGGPYGSEFKALETVVMSKNITSIGTSAFAGCINLANIEVPDNIFLGDHFLRDTAWFNNQPDGLVYIGTYLYGYKGSAPSDGIVRIKEGTKMIGNYALSDVQNITEVIIPNTVTEIGYCAFGSCRDLTDVVIPDSVTTIGNAAFIHCNNLQNVTLPKGLKSIGLNMFCYCMNLQAIEIPDSVTKIGGDAFFQTTSVESIFIPSTVTELGSGVFGAWNSNQTINFEPASKPAGWSSDWYRQSKAKVVWGYTGD